MASFNIETQALYFFDGITFTKVTNTIPFPDTISEISTQAD